MSDEANIVLQRSKALVDRLLGDRGDAGKAARAEALKLFPDLEGKLVDPNADLEPIVAPLKAQIDALTEKLTAKETAEAEAAQKALEERAEFTLQSKLDATKKTFNLTDEGLKAVMERMTATGNYADTDAAAAYVLKDYKPVETRSAALGPQAADYLGKSSGEDMERMKLLWNDADGGFLDYEIAKMEADPRDYVKNYGTPQELREYDQAMGI